MNQKLIGKAFEELDVEEMDAVQGAATGTSIGFTITLNCGYETGVGVCFTLITFPQSITGTCFPTITLTV